MKPTILLAALVVLGVSGIALAAPPAHMAIWRAQIRLTTGNSAAAATDDHVRCKLGWTNSTWLDYGRNDFEQNSAFTYDLDLTGLERGIFDVHFIRLSKTGSDGWRVKRIELIINGATIYIGDLGSGQSLDNDGGWDHRLYTVNLTDLQTSPEWEGYTMPIPSLLIGHDELVSRIEGMLGSFIYDTKLHWRQRNPVTVSRLNDHTLNCRARMKVKADRWWDPDVDVRFRLAVSVEGTKLILTTQHVEAVVDSAWYSEVLSAGILNTVDIRLKHGLNEFLDALVMSRSIELGTTVSATVIEPGAIQISLD